MPASSPSERPLCRRCVLPHSPPDLFLDETGLCNVCVQHDTIEETVKVRRKHETDFTRILNKYRGKGEYDCLVMCSGGKDSTSALYYMKKRYNMRPLAFMFDHGFETAEALRNVQRAVEILNVDFLQLRSTQIHDAVRYIIETDSKAVICHICSMWYMDMTFKMAARFDIPIIIAGWTKGQSADQEVMSKCACNVSSPEFAAMGRATVEFLDAMGRDPRFKDFPRSMDEVLKKAKKRHKSIVLSPHWFLPFDVETYVNTIQTELDWQYPEVTYPKKSTNCLLNFIAVERSMKNFGYTHYHVEMSKLIRQGEMTRGEALELLDINFGPDFLNEVARPLGVKLA